MRHLLFAILLISTFAASPSWAQNDYGVVDLVDGQVTVLGADGNSHEPDIGEIVHEGDLLTTGPDGELHISTTDNGVVALRANTRLKIQEYQANGDSSDKSVLMLLQGRFRAVTGWIGRRDKPNYEIRTPTAIIGVRGTDHEPAYIPAAVAGATTVGEPGTYDKVNEGETYIQNAKGQIAVKPNQSGFAPLQVVVPVLLTAIPGFYQPTKFEGDIKQKADELKQKLLEKPMQYKEQAERMKNQPREEAESRAREKIPGSEWIPKW